jgi:hypothetical protein
MHAGGVRLMSEATSPLLTVLYFGKSYILKTGLHAPDKLHYSIFKSTTSSKGYNLLAAAIIALISS